jgi:hypothetical protein
MTKHLTSDELRALIRGQIARHRISLLEVARQAEIPPPTVRSYLYHQTDTGIERVLRIAAAVGLRVTACPYESFVPPPPRPRGRKKSSKILPDFC